MPTIPSRTTLKTTNSVSILNAIRNGGSTNYRSAIPAATDDISSIRAIGQALLDDYPSLKNEFIDALVNRIGRVILTNNYFYNPLQAFKKGMLEYGETVEEIFVGIANIQQFDQDTAESEVEKRVIPNVRSAFHTLNYQKFYKVTVSDYELRNAFLSFEGVYDLVERIINSMIQGAEYDEFLMMKYMIAKAALAGQLHAVEVDASSMEGAVATIRGESSEMMFPSKKRNLAGVLTSTPRDRQYLILSAAVDAAVDVNVLAAAFHMEKADFLGHRIIVDSFAEFDSERLSEILGADYVPFTSDELLALASIRGVLVDSEWFMIFDKLLEMRDRYNEQGLYRNHWLHVWKIFSTSPFANADVIVPGTPTVTSVTVTPSTATVAPGASIALGVAVATTNFASKAVDWTIEADSGNTGADTDVTVDRNGLVQVSADATADDVFVVTATSVFDSTVTGTCTITIG